MDLFLCLQFPKSDAKSHSQTHIESHLNLALRGLEATQHQVHELITVVKDQSQQIKRQSHQIERLMSKDQEQLKKIERLIARLTSRVDLHSSGSTTTERATCANRPDFSDPVRMGNQNTQF